MQLIKGEANPVRVENATELAALLGNLDDAAVGTSVEAKVDGRNWVRARKVDERWRIDVRCGAWWTRQRLTPGDFMRDWWPAFSFRDRGQFEPDEVRRVIFALLEQEKTPFPILGAW